MYERYMGIRTLWVQADFGLSRYAYDGTSSRRGIGSRPTAPQEGRLSPSSAKS